MSTWSEIVFACGAPFALPEAGAIHGETYAILKRTLGHEHPNVLASATNLAGVLRKSGELAEAARLLDETLAVQERVLGGEHPFTLASKHNLAKVLQKQGGLAEAARVHRETREARVRLFGADHPDALASANSLAEVLTEKGELEEAVRILRETLQVLRLVLSGGADDHSRMLETLSELATLLTQHVCGGELSLEAEASFRRRSSTSSKILDDAELHPGLASVETCLWAISEPPFL